MHIKNLYMVYTISNNLTYIQNNKYQNDLYQKVTFYDKSIIQIGSSKIKLTTDILVNNKVKFLPQIYIL